jgi:hypothetical protein
MTKRTDLQTPKIDKRDFNDILEELRTLARYYTPGWEVPELLAGGKGSGAAMAEIFCRMMEDLVRQLNRVPGKHFFSFLDRLGFSVNPPQPASAPMTFTLAQGTEEHVLIPGRTEVAAGDTGFETEENILATPARITVLYSVRPKMDLIYDHTREFNEKTPFEPFDGKNVQEHILYLGHNDLLNIKKQAGIILYIEPFDPNWGDERILHWQYWGENREKAVDWHPLEFEVETSRQEIHLKKKTGGEIKEYEINGVKSRWIRCRVRDIQPAKDIFLHHVEIGTRGITLEEMGLEAVEGIDSELARILEEKKIDSIDALLEQTYKQIAACIPGDGDQAEKEEKAKIIKENAIQLKHQQALLDMAYHNDVPIDITGYDENGARNIYPLGKVPRSYDTFYIASQEAFSKKNLNIAIHLKLAKCEAVIDGIDLSWEYWDGKGWKVIQDLTDNTDKLTAGNGDWKTVEFTCPPDIEKIEVAGQESQWIRVRIVSGDYGKELYKKGGKKIIYVDKSHPPIIKDIKITYGTKNNSEEDKNAGNPGNNGGDGGGKTFQHHFIFNHMQYQDVTTPLRTTGKVVNPFVLLEDPHQGFYLGFDKRVEKGPISLYFEIEEFALSAAKIANLEWQYYSEKGKWQRLEWHDQTRGLMRTGTIGFIFPPDVIKTPTFGQELYWLRAVDVDDVFKPLRLAYQAARADIKLNHTREREEKPKLAPCAQLLETFNPGWHYPPEVQKYTISPKIKAIFLNTTRALQAETISDEILGPGDGTANQVFTLARAPVISGEIWVDEIGTTSENERKDILDKKEYEAEEVRDDSGDPEEFPIKWKPVEDLLGSGAGDRHYVLDRVSGRVLFGDGINGKVLPMGSDNVRANYRVGGGVKGNLPAFAIAELKSSISFVDQAFNPLPAGGGTDVESSERLVQRAPKTLKHRNRAVTAEDFEQIALQTSRDVARAKCMPNFNEKGQTEPGWVTVFVIPQSRETRPLLSLQLKRKVENHLGEHAAATLIPLNRILVSGPVYVEVSVITDLAASSSDMIPIVETSAITKISEFLHPVYGGEKGNGWEFGRLPCFSDFYSILGEIEGLDHVKYLKLNLKTYNDQEELLSTIQIVSGQRVDIQIPPYAVVYSGDHVVRVSSPGGR